MECYDIFKDLKSYNNNDEFCKFNFYEYCFPKKDCPDMHIFEDIAEQHHKDLVKDITDQINNLTINLNTYKVVELKKIAKRNKLKRYSRLKKSDLIQLLESVKHLKL